MNFTAKAKYTGGLRTTAVHLKSNSELITDAPVDNQGKGESFSPTDLVATALGSCMLTIMGIKARDKNIDIDGATAEVLKTMASNPRRISRLDIKITMPQKPFSDRDKKLLTLATEACPVGNSLHPNIELVTDIIWL
jgi:uncharacterized OsmC-like protein